MLTVEFTFILLGFIILVGYLGQIIFKKTKIPEILLLLTLGLLIGPISNALGFAVVVGSQLDSLQTFLPFFASFTLIMILFEGGMQLNFFKTIKALPISLFFTTIVYLIGVVLTVVVLFLLSLIGFIEFNLLVAIFIGAILGGTSSSIVVSLVKSTSANEETQLLLSLESALTDALSIVTVVAVAQIVLSSSISIDTLIGGVVSNFSIALLIGFFAGIIWLKIFSIIHDKPYAYLITMATLLILYAFVQNIGGDGSIAILIFGIVLGNGADITSMLQLTKRSINNNIKNFQSELSFLMKTFFFVYLGILFKLEFLTIPIVFTSISIIAFILVSRFVGANILKKFAPIFSKDAKLISLMSARGLSAAVLVSIPVTMGLDVVAPTLFSAQMLNQITAISFLVIFGTNIVTTIGIFLTENKSKEQKKEDRELLLKEIKVDLNKKIQQLEEKEDVLNQLKKNFKR